LIYKLLFIFLLLGILTVSPLYAFAELVITDMTKIDADNLSSVIAAGDMFGYDIENIGDLDGDVIQVNFEEQFKGKLKIYTIQTNK